MTESTRAGKALDEHLLTMGVTAFVAIAAIEDEARDQERQRIRGAVQHALTLVDASPQGAGRWSAFDQVLAILDATEER